MWKSVKGHRGQCGEKCTEDIINTTPKHDEENEIFAETSTAEESENLEERGAHGGDLTLPTPAREDKYRGLSFNMSSLSKDMKQMLQLNQQILALLVQKERPLSPSSSPIAQVQRPSPPSISSSIVKGQKPPTLVQFSPNSAPSVSSPAQDVPYYLQGGAKLSDSTCKSAISGEFVNLLEFISTSYSKDLEAHISDGELQLKPRKSKRALDNLHIWLQAWDEFEALLTKKCMSVHPHLYSKLASYRRLIQSLDRKYMWSAIYTYDQRFRTNVARDASVNYHVQNNDLMVTILDATAIKVDLNRCLRCKATDHYVQDCPFQSFKAEKETPYGKNQAKWFHDSREGCNNFNIGKCTYPKCTRVHVCKSCRGPEPFIRCPKCNGR